MRSTDNLLWLRQRVVLLFLNQIGRNTCSKIFLIHTFAMWPREPNVPLLPIQFQLITSSVVWLLLLCYLHEFEVVIFLVILFNLNDAI